ncbi:MAG: AmmeMemoRadiSam system protein B [Verrucomicrobiota bacterium]|nr:AmmeMemoRadiSam system protein B [Limisphaera sp.]MDW8381376.1 AmmeMemoRadiSam system protein B [Verrucomicrobiota bacterium]
MHGGLESTRPPAVAGLFYPDDPQELGRWVERFLEKGHVRQTTDPKAVIAPHAGYIYSGPVAGSAFRPWAKAAAKIERVVLVGPSHHMWFEGLALPRAGQFYTPLGPVPVDREATARLADLPQVKLLDAAHAGEHCLEVELPFLQAILPRFAIVPLVVGESSDEEVAEVLDRLWGGPETRIVISSDLSHYHPYAEAVRLDRTTADAIEARRVAMLTPERACGFRAIRGLLRASCARDLQVDTVDLRNSGDTAGPRDRVVGYGAFHFGPPRHVPA